MYLCPLGIISIQINPDVDRKGPSFSVTNRLANKFTHSQTNAHTLNIIIMLVQKYLEAAGRIWIRTRIYPISAHLQTDGASLSASRTSVSAAAVAAARLSTSPVADVTARSDVSLWRKTSCPRYSLGCLRCYQHRRPDSIADATVRGCCDIEGITSFSRKTVTAVWVSH